MARSTIGGGDDLHDLPAHEKDRLEAYLRREARELLQAGRAKERRERENRARNISRRPSKRADPH